MDHLITTETLIVDQVAPDIHVITLAANLIRRGQLVAFPTETVYGLGANAWDAVAVQRIFAAKGRPGSNPLIVHVADPVQLLNVVREWPETAERLAARFWPGPLTLVLPKSSTIPDVVTAGGPTVAVRCPNHPVARALLTSAAVPIAAPSANRSMELSPTRAEHVLRSLGGRIPLILDGGSCPGGIESTVVDLTGERVRLLRPGLISIAMLQEIIGSIEVGQQGDGPARSPGQMVRHYSPRTVMRLVPTDSLARACRDAGGAGLQVGMIRFSNPHASTVSSEPTFARFIHLSCDPGLAATRLYDALHELDQSQLDLILVEIPPEGPEWTAIQDRLARAASQAP